MNRVVLVLLGFCLAGVVVRGAAQPVVVDSKRPLWGALEPGGYSVGFRSFWFADRGRTYARPASGIVPEDKHPRPVLVHVWYPASQGSAEPMRHGEYLDLPTEPAWVSALAADLGAYATEIVCEETMGVPSAELSDAQCGAFRRVLNSPTAAERGAPAADGTWPLVIYHAGYGSSFDDNAVMCEFLASHGYLVVGSAFFEGDGGSFNIDADGDSIADIECLIRIACDRLSADRGRVALIGHSGGAHTAVRCIARPSNAIDAAVLLDTTQDYHSFADTRWDDMVPVALENAGHIDIPLLFAARQHAMFRLADRLVESPRVYATFRDLEHNSFIAQGVIAAETQQTPDAASVRHGYAELCRIVLCFLDAELCDRADAKQTLSTAWPKDKYGTAPVLVETVAPGVSQPTYDQNSSLPPTPRQIAAMLDSGEIELVAECLTRFRDDPRAAPFREIEFAMSVLFQLVHEGEPDTARRMLGCFEPQQGEIVHMFGAVARMYASVGASATAERFETVSRVLGSNRLDTDDQEKP